MAAPLDSLQWQKRVLLLFAKSRSDASLDKQLELLRERRPEISDRDLVVLTTEGDSDTMASIGYVSMPNGANRKLRERFGVFGDGMTLILVGKDGSEKFRATSVVQPDVIFRIIDAMPMRQREMREES